MGFFDTSGLPKTEKDYFQILSSLYAYELTKSPLSKEFIQIPEKALSEFIQSCERKKIATIWHDGYAHNPYLVDQSLFVAAKKVKHPEPRRLVDEFIGICLVDLSSQVDSLVREVKERYESVLESLGVQESLNEKNYRSILPRFLSSEVKAINLRPAPYYDLEPAQTYFRFNPLLQFENRGGYKWKWRGWGNTPIPREIDLLERLCDDGWTMRRQLKIILHFIDNENPLFEVQAED